MQKLFPYPRWLRYISVRHPNNALTVIIIFILLHDMCVLIYSDKMCVFFMQVNKSRTTYSCVICVPEHKVCMEVPSDATIKRTYWQKSNVKKHFLSEAHWKCLAAMGSSDNCMNDLQANEKQSRVSV